MACSDGTTTLSYVTLVASFESIYFLNYM